jgi:flagellar basal-body rod protein FlgB
MNLPDLPLMSMLRTRMSWLHQRQDVLAQNVANADTPGFVARDLKALDFDESMRSQVVNKAASLAVTNPRHISIKSTSQSKFDDFESRDVESSPNGNAVSLEAEMIKVSDTQAQFQAAANIYAKAMTMMKTAIGAP